MDGEERRRKERREEIYLSAVGRLPSLVRNAEQRAQLGNHPPSPSHPSLSSTLSLLPALPPSGTAPSLKAFKEGVLETLQLPPSFLRRSVALRDVMSITIRMETENNKVINLLNRLNN